MIKCIINADDLGVNPIVNSEIDYAMSTGVISSSTILANTDYLPEVLDIIKKHPECSFGVHLNLTQGVALHPTQLLRNVGIIDNENCFTRKFPECFSKDVLADIEEEFRSQIKLLVHAGVKLTHMDGHHHIHSKYCFRHIILKLCKEFNINIVRNRYKTPVFWSIKDRLSRMSSKNQSDQVSTQQKYISTPESVFRISLLKRLSSYIQGIKWILYFKTNKIKMTTFFGAYENIAHRVICNGYKFCTNSTIELMCHPGHPVYAAEYELVKKKYLNNIQLVSYKEI